MGAAEEALTVFLYVRRLLAQRKERFMYLTLPQQGWLVGLFRMFGLLSTFSVLSFLPAHATSLSYAIICTDIPSTCVFWPASCTIAQSIDEGDLFIRSGNAISRCLFVYPRRSSAATVRSDRLSIFEGQCQVGRRLFLKPDLTSMKSGVLMKKEQWKGDCMTASRATFI